MFRFPFSLGRLSVHTPAWLAFGLWLCVAFSVVSWGLKMGVADSVPAVAVAATEVQRIDTQAVARSLGELPTQAMQVDADSRFKLQGVLTLDGQGVALLAVDGKPAKPYRVGSMLVEGWRVQSAQGRRVTLGPSLDAPAALTLELPAPKSSTPQK